LLFLIYKLYGRQRSAKRKDDAVWPDVSHEASYEPALPPTSGAGYTMGDESRAGLVPPAHEQDPFQDAIPPQADSPFQDAAAPPGEAMGEAYSTVPDALMPATAPHHAYLQPEAPPAPQYQHYVVGQTYPQVVDIDKMYHPETRELYHGDQPVSARP